MITPAVCGCVRSLLSFELFKDTYFSLRYDFGACFKLFKLIVINLEVNIALNITVLNGFKVQDRHALISCLF